MTPKGIGFASYFLILTAVILLVMTLLASQNINLLHLDSANQLRFQTQVGLSLLNSFITITSAIAILKGYAQGRAIWHLWAVGYFVIQLWQLDNRIYLIPNGVLLLSMTFLLYAKPAQNYFTSQQKKRRKLTSKRIDHTYNIFDDKDA